MAWYDITGTIADWVMASAAVYAAYKAKNFFDDKVHSDAYELIKKVIFFQVDDLIKSINEQYSDAFQTTMKFNANAVNQEKLTTEHVDNSLELYSNTINVINSIESNIKVLIKLKFMLNDDAKIIFHEFIISVREFQKTHLEFLTITLSLLNNKQEDKISELNELIKEVESSNLNAINKYIQFYNYKEGFIEYFIKI